MADSITYIPDSNQANNALPWMMAGNGGLGGFGGGWGAGIIGFILGALIGNNGFGGLFGGNGGNAAGTGYLANALNNDTGRELIMQGINGNHEALANLSNILHADVASVQSALNAVSLGIQNVGSQVGMSSLQVINAIQSGNAALASQLCDCCCSMKQVVSQQGYENQIATLNQTNTLSNAIGANGRGITDAIADLKTSMVSEFCAARERDMQAKIDTQADIITQLRGAADNAAQTNQILGAVNALVAPLQKQVTEIEAKMPNTIPVQYPNVVAVNNTPYTGGYGFGYGVNGSSYWG